MAQSRDHHDVTGNDYEITPLIFVSLLTIRNIVPHRAGLKQFVEISAKRLFLQVYATSPSILGPAA
jgi:hypothetical protein